MRLITLAVSLVATIGCAPDRSGAANATGELQPLGGDCICNYDDEQLQISCGDDFTMWVPLWRRLNESQFVDVELWDYPIEECGPYMGYGAAEMWVGTKRYDPSASDDLMFPVRPVHMRRVFSPAQPACQPSLPWCIDPECHDWPDSVADDFWIWCDGPIEIAP